MDAKINYLKRQLEQALMENNYNEANRCYQELLKISDGSGLSEYAKQLGEYNQAVAKANSGGVNEQALKQRIFSAKQKWQASNLGRWICLIGGLVSAVLAVVCLVIDESSNDADLFDVIIAFSALFFVLWIAAIPFSVIAGWIYNKLLKYRVEAFHFVCEKEPKLQYLPNVEKEEKGNVQYVGQIERNERNGFGVGLCNNGIYVGDWKNGLRSGVGKLISDDMRMTLEGEFVAGIVEGTVDIVWDDGGEWHGEYKGGLPWKGEGKTVVGNRVLEGTWKNGMKIL